MALDRQLVASRIRSRRAELDLTQEELTERASGLGGPAALSKWESALYLPSAENIVALAQALDTTPNYLLGWDDS